VEAGAGAGWQALRSINRSKKRDVRREKCDVFIVIFHDNRDGVSTQRRAFLRSSAYFLLAVITFDERAASFKGFFYLLFSRHLRTDGQDGFPAQ